LSCEREIEGNTAIFIVFVVSGFFVFLISFFSDTYGRKLTFIGISVFAVIGALISIFPKNLICIVLGVAIQYLCKSILS
jgi:MFS family permease